MHSREIVRRTLAYESPDRVARSFRGASDMHRVAHQVRTRATRWEEVGGGRWERTDEWGNRWGRVDPTSKGEVIRGALDSFDAIEGYEFPDFSNPADYAAARAGREDHPEMWVIGSMPGFAFNIARKLFKLEEYLVGLLAERERLALLHDRIDRMLADMIRNYAACGIDAVMFCEDWGTQSQTLVSPALWREEFFPRFQRLCALAHEHGLAVMMHSCGAIGAIVPGLVEAGIDCLQFDQPALHTIDQLAAWQELGKITFWCPVDIQRTLQTRDAETIRAEAREMIDRLWRGRGGFIAGFYGDEASIGLTPEWQAIACEAFREWGVRERYAAGMPDA